MITTQFGPQRVAAQMAQVGMLFNAWLLEDEQVFRGLQDRAVQIIGIRNEIRYQNLHLYLEGHTKTIENHVIVNADEAKLQRFGGP